MFTGVVVVAHHPSDVTVGALVGAVGAVLVRRWFAARRLVFSAHDLKTFPGPSLRRATAAARQILLDHSVSLGSAGGRGTIFFADGGCGY